MISLAAVVNHHQNLDRHIGTAASEKVEGLYLPLVIIDNNS
jgi:hypothetical protein